MGPREATVRNLNKQISAKVEASERLQREWLADQTLLVSVSNVVEGHMEKVGHACVCACSLLYCFTAYAKSPWATAVHCFCSFP